MNRLVRIALPAVVLVALAGWALWEFVLEVESPDDRAQHGFSVASRPVRVHNAPPWQCINRARQSNIMHQP